MIHIFMFIGQLPHAHRPAWHGVVMELTFLHIHPVNAFQRSQPMATIFSSATDWGIPIDPFF
jgi:hypothetical protein